jgi:hypothetical protein
VKAPDDLPLPDLYLIDSAGLLSEVGRIRGLVLQVPFTETSHAATQTVVDALWRLERDLHEILKVKAQMQSAFVQKGDELTRSVHITNEQKGQRPACAGITA